MKNYYQVLGLEEGATLDEIKVAYKEYVVKFHPDKHNGDEFFKERFQEVQEAYHYLRTQYIKSNNLMNECETASSVEPSNSDDIKFTCSHNSVYKGDIIILEWEVNFPCSISLDIDKSYSNHTRHDLPLHGSTEIRIGKIEEEVVAVLHCSINNRTISKEIHLIRNRAIDVMLQHDKYYQVLINTKKCINFIFKVLPWGLTILYIIMIIYLKSKESFPIYTSYAVLNYIIEWGAYILGWLMICYIAPLGLEMEITSPIDYKIEQRIREVKSKHN